MNDITIEKVQSIECNHKQFDYVKIYEDDDFIVEYDRSRKMYRVSVFEGGHFYDECKFNAYEDKIKYEIIDYLLDALEYEHFGASVEVRKEIKNLFGVEV